jgi:Fe-S cluster assembly scaffold protein SufB
MELAKSTNTISVQNPRLFSKLAKAYRCRNRQPDFGNEKRACNGCLHYRLKGLEIFNSKPMPEWGGDIAIDFQDIYYYLKPTDKQGRTWDEVPQEIKDTFDKLGIPKRKRSFWLV